MRIAVIGGGMAGLSAARVCTERHAEVVVFDKGRGPGGRMSTRRQGDLWFDHGAQYFTAKDERFAGVVDGWVREGVAARWHGRIGRVRSAGAVEDAPTERARYVGVPGMSAVVRRSGETLGPRAQVRFGVRISAAQRADGRWLLVDEQGAGVGAFDALIVAAPAPQGAELLVDAPGLRERVRAVAMRPCWAAMASFDARVPVDFDGVFVDVRDDRIGAALSWVARDSSKPARPARETWVLHASPAWSEQHIDRGKDDVAQDLLRAFFDALGVPALRPATLDAHRWRYASTDARADDALYVDRERLVAACGDWTRGGRVEGAYLSGLAAAEDLLDALSAPARTRPGA